MESSRTQRNTARSILESNNNLDSLTVDQILNERKRLEDELMKTDEAIMYCSKNLTSRHHKGMKREKGCDFSEGDLNSYRSDISSVDMNLGEKSDRSHTSSVWTGRDSSYNLSKTKREYVREVIEKKWNIRPPRTKSDIPHQMVSRNMSSIMFSGHIGNNTYGTENKDFLTPKYLTPRENQDVASLRRPKGELTSYLNASIQKNINLKLTGHA